MKRTTLINLILLFTGQGIGVLIVLNGTTKPQMLAGAGCWLISWIILYMLYFDYKRFKKDWLS